MSHQPHTHRLNPRHSNQEEASDREVSDGELVARYQQDRDADAFAVLVSRHQRLLWVTAVRILRDPHDASDVVQLVWVNVLRAFARPGGFDGRSAVSTWLQRIVRNESVDRLRRNRMRDHQALDAHHDPVAPGDAYAAADAQIVLAQLLDVLPAERRAAIELVWLRGLSVNEAAAVLGVAPGTVKSRCARARQAMAASVARAGLITTALHDDREDVPPT